MLHTNNVSPSERTKVANCVHPKFVRELCNEIIRYWLSTFRFDDHSYAIKRLWQADEHSSHDSAITANPSVSSQ